MILTHLAVEGRVAASTQNQALAALLFLYRTVLERDLYGGGLRLMDCLRQRVKDLNWWRINVVPDVGSL